MFGVHARRACNSTIPSHEPSLVVSMTGHRAVENDGSSPLLNSPTTLSSAVGVASERTFSDPQEAVISTRRLPFHH